MTETGEAQPSHRRGRSILATTFGILAVLGVLASVLATQSYQSLFKTAAVARAVDQALQEPEVVDALADHLADQLIAAVSVESLIEDQLPPGLEQLAPMLVGSIHAVVHDGISRTLTDDGTRRVLVGVAERGHRSAMRVLDGGRLSDGVTLDGGTASVNLLPIMGEALALVQGAGLLTGVDLPRFREGGDPETQIQELEAAIGRPLPPDFGQLAVYDSERVAAAGNLIARAQQALVLFRQSVVVIVALTVVSLVASLVFAVRRRRALLFLSLGVVGAMAVGRAIIAEVVAAAPGLAVRPGARAAIRTVVSTMAEGLMSAVTFSLVAALMLTAVAYLSGPRGPGRSLRTTLRRNREVVTLVAFGAVVAVLWFSAFSLGPLVLVTLASAALLSLAWLPSGRGAPDGSSPPVSAGRQA